MPYPGITTCMCVIGPYRPPCRSQKLTLATMRSTNRHLTSFFASSAACSLLCGLSSLRVQPQCFSKLHFSLTSLSWLFSKSHTFSYTSALAAPILLLARPAPAVSPPIPSCLLVLSAVSLVSPRPFILSNDFFTLVNRDARPLPERPSPRTLSALSPFTFCTYSPYNSTNHTGPRLALTLLALTASCPSSTRRMVCFGLHSSNNVSWSRRPLRMPCCTPLHPQYRLSAGCGQCLFPASLLPPSFNILQVFTAQSPSAHSAPSVHFAYFHYHPLLSP